MRLRIAALFVLSCLGVAAMGQGPSQWQPLVNQPTFSPGTPIQLTDGSVVIEDVGPGGSSNWWKLTPDSFGNYVNGTWSQIASLPSGYGPLYFSSAVLKDGRLVVLGGEYNFGSAVWTNLGAIYDPVANVWNPLAGPGWSMIGDAQNVVFPDGTFMMANILNGQSAILDPATLTWTQIAGNGKLDRMDEEGWTLMPDGSVLTVDAKAAPAAQRYIPGTQTWISAGNTPNSLEDANSQEVGPQVLLPNGTVLCIGATGYNAIWTPPGNLFDPGSWTAAPSFPLDGNGNQLDEADGAACLMPSGNVLLAASPGVFNTPTTFFEFDGTNLNPIQGPPNAGIDSSFYFVFMMLPNGQVMVTDQSNDIEIYTPTGSPNDAWRPTIASCPATVSPGNSYSISGTQFNGLSQASAFGDDATNATNYPLVRITNSTTGHVFYCRTHDHSTMAVATGAAPVSTNFDVPAGIETGDSVLEVVANGIPSAQHSITVALPALNSFTLSAGTVNAGDSPQGTVTLNAVPLSDMSVALSSNSAVATVPASVTVSAGTTSSSFAIQTQGATSQQTATLTATLGSVSLQQNLSVNPPTLTSLTFSANPVFGTQNSQGTVTISTPASSLGVSVALTSDNAAATVPASATVSGGSTSQTFTVTTGAVATPTTANITATIGSSSMTQSFVVNPPVPAAVTLSPASVKGGKSSKGTVTLNFKAPSGGLTVRLSVSNTALATVPATVTVPAGATTSNAFNVTTKHVTRTSTVNVIATYNSVSAQATLTITR